MLFEIWINLNKYFKTCVQNRKECWDFEVRFQLPSNWIFFHQPTNFSSHSWVTAISAWKKLRILLNDVARVLDCEYIRNKTLKSYLMIFREILHATCDNMLDVHAILSSNMMKYRWNIYFVESWTSIHRAKISIILDWPIDNVGFFCTRLFLKQKIIG